MATQRIYPFLVVLVVLLVSFYAVLATNHTGRGSLPVCSQQQLSLATLHENLIIYIEKDGTLSLQYTHCRIASLADNTRVRRAVHRCLSGTHLTFLGDSLSRYLYMSLSYFLAYGVWTVPFAAESVTGKVVSSEFEYGGNWPSFHAESSTTFTTLRNEAHSPPPDVVRSRNHLGSHGIGHGDDRYQSYELCDCFRNAHSAWQQDKFFTLENRHFRVSSSNFSNVESDIRLSYLQWFGSWPMRGTKKLSFMSPENPTGTTKRVSTNVSTHQTGLQQFLLELDRMGRKLCPKASTTASAEVSPSAPTSSAMLPLAPDCLAERFSDLDRERGYQDFPPLVHSEDRCSTFNPDPASYPEPFNQTLYRENMDYCQQYVREILSGLKTTHLLINTAYWPPYSISNFGSYFLGQVVEAANEVLAAYPPSSSVSSERARLAGDHHQHANHGNSVVEHLQLPRVTWRETTASTKGPASFVAAEKMYVERVVQWQNKRSNTGGHEGNRLNNSSASLTAHRFGVYGTAGKMLIPSNECQMAV